MWTFLLLILKSANFITVNLTVTFVSVNFTNCECYHSCNNWYSAMFNLKNGLLIEERLTFSNKIYFSKEFLIPWRQRQIFNRKANSHLWFSWATLSRWLFKYIVFFYLSIFCIVFFFIVFKKKKSIQLLMHFSSLELAIDIKLQLYLWYLCLLYLMYGKVYYLL